MKRRTETEAQSFGQRRCLSSASSDAAITALQGCKNILVLVGAGISTSAGIPDFRSRNGLNGGSATFDAAHSKALPGAFKTTISEVLACVKKARPTPFHGMLQSLGPRLLRLYSQNIDGLEASIVNKVLLHGSLLQLCCTIRSSHSFPSEVADLWDRCPTCVKEQEERTMEGLRRRSVGIVRPRITLFNESTYDEVDIGAMMESDMKQRPDALIVAGTTLAIRDAKDFSAELARLVAANGGTTVWVSRGKCPIGNMEYHLDIDCDDFAKKFRATFQ